MEIKWGFGKTITHNLVLKAMPNTESRMQTRGIISEYTGETISIKNQDQQSSNYAILPQLPIIKSRDNKPVAQIRSVSVKQHPQPQVNPYTDAPASLYFSSSKSPSLAQLRDALRRNEFLHTQFDHNLGSKAFKKQFEHNQALKIEPHLFNPIMEQNTQAIDLVLPSHIRLEHQSNTSIKAKIERGLQKTDRSQVNAKIQMQATNQLTTRSLSNEKLETLRQLYRPPVQHKLQPLENPFRDKEPTKMSDLFMTKGAKRAMDQFEATRQEKGIPDSLTDLPPEQVKRIYLIIEQETKRLQATSNPNIQLAKIKQQVTEMVNQGYTFQNKKFNDKRNTFNAHVLSRNTSQELLPQQSLKQFSTAVSLHQQSCTHSQSTLPQTEGPAFPMRALKKQCQACDQIKSKRSISQVADEQSQQNITLLNLMRQIDSYDQDDAGQIFDAADSGLKDINYDVDRWQTIISNLLINDNLVVTLNNAYTTTINAEQTSQAVLQTMMELKNPKRDEKSKIDLIMRQTNSTGKKKVFKPSKFKFGPDIHKYLTSESAEYRELR